MAAENATNTPDGSGAAQLGALSSDTGPSGDSLSPLPSINEISTGNPGDGLSQVDAAVNECQQVYQSVVDTVNSHIGECIGECRLGAATCVSCILGQIERETGLGQQVIAKCWDRIGGKLTAAVNDALQASMRAGVQPPTEAQYQAFLNGQPIPTSDSAPSGSISTPVLSTPDSNSTTQVPLPPGVTLPDGAVLPVQDQTTGQIGCPDPSPPFRSPNSPTGWLNIQYVPTYGPRGEILWCAPITHIAPAPTAPDGGTTGSGTGGQPTGDNTTGGNTGGTGSDGTPTVPGGLGGNTDSAIPNCPAGTSAYFNAGTTVDQLPIPYNVLSIKTGRTNSDGQEEWCLYGSTTEQPPDDTQPEQPINSPSAIITDTGCSPDRLSAWAARIDQFISTSDGQFGQLFQAFGATVGTLLSIIASKVVGADNIAGLGFIASAVTGAASQDFLRKLIMPTTQPTQCNSDAFFAVTIANALTKAFGGWFGTVPVQTIRTIEYADNYICQTILPTTDQFDLMFRGGYITEPDWLNGVKFNGHCPDWQKIIIKASKNRIGIQDAYRLFKLGKLSDSEFIQAWRRQGVEIEEDLATWDNALQQYPGQADIIRMMVRDIADPQVVEDLGLDAEFTDKWQGFLKQWGESQGISDDIAQAYWRAHWQSPSPQQVYEWLHRLRTDDRDPDDPNKTLAIDKDRAARLLQIADYVPGLVDFYIATSYRPLTRVDIRRMYEVGTFKTLDPVRRGYRDLGYDAINAERLADFTERISRPKRAALAGELPSREVQRAYQNDLLSRNEASALLDQSGLTRDQTETYLRAADDRRTIANRKLRLDALRKRYFVGEFDNQAVIFEMAAIGISPDAAGRLQVAWQDERAAKAKQPTIAMLCGWYGKGLIDLEEYYRRVRNLNYSEVDAQRVIQMCQLGITEHKQKEYEKEQARIAKEEKARQRQKLLDEKAQRAYIREQKLKHKLEHKEVTKKDEKGTKVTVTDTVIDKPDDNITDTVQTVEVNTIQPPP